MSKVALIIVSLLALIACDTSPAPQKQAATPSNAASAQGAKPAQTTAAAVPASGNDVQSKLQELAGSGAADCGVVKTLSADDIQKASDCAMAAAKAKKPFTVSYNMPGLSVGVAGNSDGKFFTVQSDEANGKPAPPRSQPCPAELRLAQSGRVTCMPVGSMGVAPGSGNPHGGASPHGGGMTAPATASPHGTPPTKSH